MDEVLHTPDEQAFLTEQEELLRERLAVLIVSCRAVGLSLTVSRDLAQFVIDEAERVGWTVEVNESEA